MARDFFKDPAVLWAYIGPDDRGEDTIAEPIDIMCRWEDSKNDPENPKEENTAFDAWAAVKIDIPDKSILRQGTIADLPVSPNNLYCVSKFDKFGDLKRRKFRREMQMVRFGDTLPTVIEGTGTG